MPSPHFRQKLLALFGMSVVDLGLVTAEVEERPSQVAAQLEEAASQAIPVQALVIDPAIPPLVQSHGLVGRDDLLRHLKQQLLREETVALSALNGLPGVGKTALATALVHDEEVRAHFVGGILWAGLGYEPDLLRLLVRWGTLLGNPPSDMKQRSSPEAWAANIHTAIGQRRMLLVLDDAWEISEALALRVGGQNCTHLVTTRFPEIARRFAVDGTIMVHELEEADGRLLLMRLAPEVVQAEPKEAQALVTAVGGLPLALTLLGNFLRAQAHSGQPRRLRSALTRLQRADERLHLSEPQPLVGGHSSLAAGTPLSLQAVIGLSDQQVSEEARTTLRALAVFSPKPNTFSEEAAVAVSALPVETLDVLTDAGLLESSGPERYTLHQTIADYARAHLTDTTATVRLVDYFVSYVEAHAEDYTALDLENRNILAALEVAFEQRMWPALIRGVHAFAPLLIMRGLYTLAEMLLQRSFEAAQALEDRGGQATAWLHLGKIARQQGNYEQAHVYWQKGLMLARTYGHSCVMAHSLWMLGGLAWTQGQLQPAHQFMTEALEMLRSLGDQHGVADLLNSLGNLAAEQGQPEQARLLYKEALDNRRSLGDQHGLAITLQNLGILAREQGLAEEAHQLYIEALTILRDLGDRYSSAVVLMNLGNLARHQGQFAQAHEFLDEALVTHRQLGERRHIAFSLLNIGNLALDQGQFTQARALLDEALAIFRGLQVRRDIAITLQTLGILARYQGQFEQAREFLDEALMISHELEDQRQGALTQRELGNIAREQRQLEEAHQLYTATLSTLLQLGDQREVAVTRREMAILARDQGRMQDAHQLLSDALATSRQINDRRSVAQELKELSLLMQQQELWEQALHTLLNASVGLALVNVPDVSSVKELIDQLRVRMGEDAFLAVTNQTALETPEPAYGLDQATWATSIQNLAAQKLPHQVQKSSQPLNREHL
jgi:tetratricopeptide (TPR) repeat protein